MFGNRQSPALLPSVNRWLPLARDLQSSSASSQVLVPKASPFFNQTSFVRLSVTVPFPLSVKRGVGPCALPPVSHRPARFRRNRLPPIILVKSYAIAFLLSCSRNDVAFSTHRPHAHEIELEIEATGQPTAMATYQPRAGKAATAVLDQ
jgi:hypothetical protein